MLSIGTLSAGQAASGYYKSEGYYIEGTPEAEHSAIYHGKGADGADLVGAIDDAAFAALLEGETPDGRLLGRYRDGERQHRPGLDLTFSAPKGVSIAALVGGDTRIIKAHTEAVKEALNYAEANLIQTRRMVNGELIRETGGQMIAGIFQHDTSRALDPQLHSHAVITNIIKDSTGTYRSMANDRFFQNGRIDGRVSTTIFLGQLYRNAFAAKLEQLGYQTYARDDGLFDIKGIPQNLIDEFSKRRKEIEASLKERGMEANSYNSQLAALATRASKKPVERAELRAAWDAEVKALGIDMGQVLKDARSLSAPDRMAAPEPRAARAVDYAVRHFAERNAIYARAAVVDKAMKYAPTVTERAIDSEIARQVRDKELFTLERPEGQFLTDLQNVRTERENIYLMTSQQGRDVLDMRSSVERLTRRTSDAIVARKLERTTLTAGQQEAVALTLSSKDGVVGVQGYAGTGKTYALATAVRMAEARGYAIDGLAPSHKAVTALSEAVPETRTVQSALVRYENSANLGDKSKTILVVDEASMLSSEAMQRVLMMAEGAGYARTVLVGDIKQLEAVDAGSAFRSLQEAGMRTALMSDIQRQRSEFGKQTVLAAIAGDITRAMQGVSEVSEVGGENAAEKRTEIADKLASSYLALSPKDRDATGLIVLTNAMRHEVNASIQNSLWLRGKIGGERAELATLVPKYFTQAEAGEIGSYKVGDIVVSPVVAKSSGLTSNTLYEVTKIDHAERQLTLTSPDREEVKLDLHWKSRIAQKLIVFGADTQEFLQGDLVKFKITDRENGIVNSAEGKIEKIDTESFTVKTKEGETLTLPSDSLAAKGMQLAYATTAHDFQGSTVDRVLLGMSSTEQLSDQKSFYVALSRMRDSTHLVTDDTGKLTDKIADNTGERVNALEALAEEKARQKTPEELRVEEAVRSTREVFRALHARDDTGPNTGPKSRPFQEAARDANSDPATAEKYTRDNDPEIARLEELKTQIERDQKTRDERSR